MCFPLFLFGWSAPFSFESDFKLKHLLLRVVSFCTVSNLEYVRLIQDLKEDVYHVFNSQQLKYIDCLVCLALCEGIMEESEVGTKQVAPLANLGGVRDQERRFLSLPW